MRNECIGGCAKAKEDLNLDAPGCCDSCHIDNEDYGYDMLTLYAPGSSTKYYEVCCKVIGAYGKNQFKSKEEVTE